MEPKTIEPQDVRPGDRICVAWSTQGVDRTMTLTVAEVDLESMLVKSTGGDWATLDAAGRATITLIDRPEPSRPVGSHWLDPETDAEYVRTDGPKPASYRRYTGGVGISAGRLIEGIDDAAIARLTPLRAFDPAAMWPASDTGEYCEELRDKGGCCREPGHAGLHAAYTDITTPPYFVWGDPR